MINFNELEKKQFVVLVFESAMALLYPILGIFLLKVDIPQISYGFRIAFGIILILYGIFRIWRAYKKLFEN